jgi:hypothetical protein
MSSELERISFGKYRGQPVEVLQQDPSYCDWLVAQPWFREKCSRLNALVINNFTEPSETPEHNRLQVRFLDELFRQRFLTASSDPAELRDTVWNLKQDLVEGRQEVLVELRERLAVPPPSAPAADAKDWEQQRYVKDLDARRQREEALSWCERDLRTLDKLNPERCHWLRGDVEFEPQGADVRLTAYLALCDPTLSQLAHVDGALARPGIEWDGVRWRKEGNLRARYNRLVECKPSLGDDFPAVLRQMRRAESNVLLVGGFDAEGATLEQVREMFGHIKAVTLADVEAATERPLS